MDRVIFTENLTKDYRTGFRMQKVRAIEDLNLEVFAHEIFGFLGPNGAGKTTTLKILVGLAHPTKGRASVFGKSPNHIETKKRIGFLPESPYFYEYLNAKEYLEFCCQVSGIKDNVSKRINRLLELVRLAPFAKLPIRGYSRGMLQRLGIAQVMVTDPELVILDEPMGGLDPIGRREFRDIIIALKEQGKTVFFSTHILTDVEMICDRVGIILNGKLVSTGNLDKILAEKVEMIDIVAEGLDHKTIRAIEKIASKVIVGDNRALITVQSEETGERILTIIREVRAKLVSFQPRRKTLEDHFISQIQKERLKEI